jgi:hypothetical protein
MIAQTAKQWLLDKACACEMMATHMEDFPTLADAYLTKARILEIGAETADDEGLMPYSAVRNIIDEILPVSH